MLFVWICSPNPSPFPCLHSFCEKCLGNLALLPQGGGHALSCPVCRSQVRLPEDGVSGFPNAFHLNDLLELRQQLKKLSEAKSITMANKATIKPLSRGLMASWIWASIIFFWKGASVIFFLIGASVIFFWIGASVVPCQLTPLSGSCPSDCDVKGTCGGMYNVTCTPTSRGHLQLRVRVGGIEIPGSPFTVSVSPSPHYERYSCSNYHRIG